MKLVRLVATRIFVVALCGGVLGQPQPQRIISTSPSITETLFAIGLGDRVIGVSTYCRYPAEAARLPRIGTYLKPNVEMIARMKPDLVVVQKLPTRVFDQLKDLSIPVVEIDSGDLHQNLDSMLAIGKAAGAEAAARSLVDRINGQLAALRAANAGRPARSVAFVVGRAPGRLEGLFVAGGGSYLSELITAAGGRNVFADSGQAYIKTSLESLLRRNPDVLIDMGEMAETTGVTEAAKRAVVKLWSTRSNLKAVREKRVFAIASDIFVVPGPRMVDAAQAFAKMIGSETGSR